MESFQQALGWLQDFSKKDRVLFDMEARESSDFSVSFQKGQLKKRSLSNTRNLSLRLARDNRQACSYTKDISKEGIEMCYQLARDSLKMSDREASWYPASKPSFQYYAGELI